MIFAKNILENNQGSKIVYDVKCSKHLEKIIIESGGLPILSRTGHYYEEEIMATEEQDFLERIEQTLLELQYVDDEGDNLQSPNDNSQTYGSTMKALNLSFHQLMFSWESSFSKSIIGGLRFKTVEEEHKMARFIRIMESFLIDSGKLNPAFYLYIGKKA